MVDQKQSARPRILVLASTYPRWRGDPEPGFVHELSKRLVDAFEVSVLCPHAPGAAEHETVDGVHVRRFRYAPVRLQTLVHGGGIAGNLRRSPWKWMLLPGFLLAMVWSISRELRRSRIDLIQAHWIIPQGICAAISLWLCRSDLPMVVTSHGGDLFGLRGRVSESVKRRVVKRSRILTVVSRAMVREMLALGASQEKVFVAPMGVDMVDRFSPCFELDRSNEEILFVGRLVEKKGLRHLIEAMPHVLRAKSRATLTVAGFGPELEPMKRLAQQLGVSECISFIGPVAQKHLPDLYRRAAVFVAPFVVDRSGDQEGLGLVLVEALACGCPVVCSDLPATRDVVGSRGVPPGDSIALADRIIEVLGVLRDESRIQATHQRDELMDRFDWSAVASRYRSILASVIGGFRVGEVVGPATNGNS